MKHTKNNVHYAWIVLLLAFFALLAAQGIRLSFGAFITPWENEFQTSRAVISSVALISYIIYGISQPYVGKLIDQFGVRTILSISTLLIGISTILTFFTSSIWQLIIIYGFIASIGFGGASNVAGAIIITNWFDKKRGFALGLMTAGNAGGQLLLVPTSLLLIDSFGWKMTVLILGFSLSVLVFPLLLLFLRTHPKEKGLSPFGSEIQSDQAAVDQKQSTQVTKTKISIFMLLKQKKFLFLLFPFFVCGVTTSGLIDTHLIPFAHNHGFSPTVTGSAISTLAAFNIAGTILSGHLSDRWNCKNMLAALYGLRAATIVILILISNVPPLQHSLLLFIFAISFGIVDFATVAPTVRLTTEYFKEYSLGAIIGWIYLSHQIGAALGSFYPGLLYDLTGSYSSAFMFSIILLVVASVFSYMLPVWTITLVSIVHK
jgi:sugar phosphate permease